MRTIVGRGLLLCAIALSGCYRATFIRDPQAVRGVEHDQWNHFFIFGLVGEADVDVRFGARTVPLDAQGLVVHVDAESAARDVTPRRTVIRIGLAR